MPIWEENGGNLKVFYFRICLGCLGVFLSREMNMQVMQSVGENYVLVLLHSFLSKEWFVGHGLLLISWFRQVRKQDTIGASGRIQLEWTGSYFVSQRKWGQTVWKMDE